MNAEGIVLTQFMRKYPDVFEQVVAGYNGLAVSAAQQHALITGKEQTVTPLTFELLLKAARMNGSAVFVNLFAHIKGRFDAATVLLETLAKQAAEQTAADIAAAEHPKPAPAAPAPATTPVAEPSDDSVVPT